MTEAHKHPQAHLYPSELVTLALMKPGFTTTSGKMMATEPGKAATDKVVEPIVDGAQANMEPSGDVTERVALMNTQ